jgi:hypothetical protein
MKRSLERRSDRRLARIVRRLAKEIVEIGGCGCGANDIAPAKLQTHWATYRRLEAQCEELQTRWAIGALGRFGIVA